MASLCSHLRSFGSKCTVFEESTCDLVGTFRSLEHCAPLCYAPEPAPLPLRVIWSACLRNAQSVLTATAFRGTLFPQKFLLSWYDWLVQRLNAGNFYHEMRKVYQHHCACCYRRVRDQRQRSSFRQWGHFKNVRLPSLSKYVLSTMGVSKESISKFLIGNRFYVKLRILSPENCKQSLQVKS